MKKIKIHLSLIIILLFNYSVQAQESVNGSGGEATGTGGTASYSVGQVVYQTHTGTSNSEAQGVQQPYEISVISSTTTIKDKDFNCKVYPNPSVEYLIIELEELSKDMQYALYSVDGKLLKSSMISDQKSSLSMQEYVPATYLLELKKGDENIQTFKIIKNEK